MFYLLDIQNGKVLTCRANPEDIPIFVKEHFLEDAPGLVMAVDTNTAAEIAAIGYFQGKHEYASHKLIHSS